MPDALAERISSVGTHADPDHDSLGDVDLRTIMMLLARSLDELAFLPSADRPSFVTIGNFDGVHRGHQRVIAQVRDRARLCGARSVVVTFDPHPANMLRGGGTGVATRLITPLPRKLELLAQTGVDLTLVLPFTYELSRLTARQFAKTILCEALHAAEVHEGETFRFGYRAEADMESLVTLGRELCFSVHAHKPVIVRGAPVSSSRIRSLIAGGSLSEGRALLTRPFSLDSTPASGRGYGSRYAVPTINLRTPEELLPANGVYITRLRIGAEPNAPIFAGVTNVGNRPTFGADSYAIETHLFEFTPVYLNEETPLRLEFLHRLRDERRFDQPDALKQQIGLDIAHAQRFLRLCRPVFRVEHA